MDKNSEEKRKQDRIRQHSFLRINNNLALLIDISFNGMRIACQQVPDEPLVNIEISIEGTAFKFEGAVRWTSDKNSFSGLYSIGIYFENPPASYKKLITRLLK